MSIPMNSICLECFLAKRLDQARQLGTDEQATDVARMLSRMFAESPPDMDSAILGGLCDQEMNRIYGLDADRMREEKEMSNRFVLERLSSIRDRIAGAEDPVYAALQFSVLGNYLDFSALYGQVSFQQLEEMLDSAFEIDLDRDCYRDFVADLQKGKRFLYITDNAGEICFDRLMAETLQKAYPHLEITFLVRGLPVSNDATREDAEIAGITFPVLDNGTAIGGTALTRISREALDAVESADVILAKGMGNTESMYGCGYNVYYAFLVKCARFMQFFQAPKLKPMFIRDKK